jgi:glycine hydroxymethyltransferase
MKDREIQGEVLGHLLELPPRVEKPRVIETLLERHNAARRNAINLIVSENRMSDRAVAPLSSDIQSRYAASFYAGTEPAQEIISTVTEMAKRVFGAKFANLSPISGNMALLAVIFSLTKNQDYVGRVPPFFPGGGYPLNYEVFDRKPLPLPFSDSTWQLDIPKTLELLEQHKPPLVVLGSSIVTFPMPVREVSDVVHRYGGLVAYDGSHPMGLIVGGQYQDPLREGADLLFGSTHKTFPGPQGGIILTNSEEIHKRVELLANFTPLNGPTLICNPHLARIASTGIVLEETRWHDYASQVVSNARTIAYALREEGIPMRGMHAKNYPEPTYCHQVITNYSREEGIELRNHLARHHINVDGFLRIGTSEITRLGFKEDECQVLGKLLACLLKKNVKDTAKVSGQINDLILSHRTVVL